MAIYPSVLGLHVCDFMFRFFLFFVSLVRAKGMFATDRPNEIEYVCSNSLFTPCYILLIKFSLQYMLGGMNRGSGGGGIDICGFVVYTIQRTHNMPPMPGCCVRAQ